MEPEGGYALLDSGEGRKWERFGAVSLIRPCCALWRPQLEERLWLQAHAEFRRQEGEGWELYKKMPESWQVALGGVRMHLQRTDFGHIGLFPEHAAFWPKVRTWFATRKGGALLNLFAYSGGATLAAAQGGAHVTHVDASKGMVQWARANAALNGLEQAPVRWIVEDVRKYVQRLVRKEQTFDGIILDPPSFGRGASKEVFKIERDLPPLLEQCVALLSRPSAFLLLTCHTPGYTPLFLQRVLEDVLGKRFGAVEAGEMVVGTTHPVPCGAFAWWNQEAR